MEVQSPMLSQACNLTAGKMSMLSNIEFTEDETSEVERLQLPWVGGRQNLGREGKKVPC
jgi:hypothetical protein